jgi:7-dehydrocholesterol reductase
MTTQAAAAAQAPDRPVRVWGQRKSWFRTWGFPLVLITVCPPLTILLWIITVFYGGSITDFASTVRWDDVVARLPLPSLAAVEILGAWFALALVLLKILPGKTQLGPFTPMGNRPAYKLNGVLAFVFTHALLYVAAYPLGLFSPTIVYDHFGEIILTLSAFALVFCVFLYVKGVVAPSTSDASRSGNLIFDYYWGVELHPRLFGVSLKQWFNCRVAMMGWSVILWSFLAKQHAIYGHVSDAMWISVGLQTAYIFKFFVWEGGYFNSLDIMHDRFGFYICWGVLGWLPCVYTLVGLYLVGHPTDFSLPVSAAIVVLGLGSIWINYAADAQRQRVRASNGAAKVWGKPAQVLRAEYTTGDGEKRYSLLLLSGWWSVARHFHYVPEILLSLAWTLPAGFGAALPYFYVLYLTILLVDRSGRDDLRCRQKYGPYWDQYCQRVPSKIIPGVY